MPSESSVPDPEKARTPAEFVHQLRRLKAWSGLTYRQLERRAGEHGDVLPHSTVATALSRESLPRVELVRALVRACGCDEKTAGTWVAVRRRLATGPDRTEAAPRTAPPPRSGDHDRRTPPRQAARLAPVLLAALFAISASSPTAAAPRKAAVTAGAPVPAPAAWWRFEEAGGTTALDSSGHGADGAIEGGAVRTAVPGGHALAFDGGGHVIARGAVIRTDEAFTITAWVRLDETGEWGTVVSEHHGADAPDVALLDYDAEHRDWAFMMPDRRKGWAMGDETVFSGLRPVRGQWVHLAAVHDPADRRVCLYVGGGLQACRTRASLVRANGPLDVGRALADGAPVDGWHGAIDDVRVFAHALTGEQIGDVVAHRA